MCNKLCGKEYFGHTITRFMLPFDEDGLPADAYRFYLTYNVIGDGFGPFVIGPFTTPMEMHEYRDKILNIDPFKYIDWDYLFDYNATDKRYMN